MTPKQREWLIALRDIPNADRTFRPSEPTERSCEQRGWAEYVSLGGTMKGWKITQAGRDALEQH